MTMSKTKGYGYWRMSRLLGLREVFSSFHGGATNLPWEVVNDKVDSVVVDKPAPPAEAPSRRQVVEASKSVVEEERGETAENLKQHLVVESSLFKSGHSLHDDQTFLIVAEENTGA